MPVSKFTDRIEKIDFFAVLPAGIYVMSVLCVCMYEWAYPTSETKTIFSILTQIACILNKNVTFAILVIFGAYIVGSIIRSVPVDWAEWSIPHTKKSEISSAGELEKTTTEEPKKSTNKEANKFPYQNLLIDALKDLKDAEAATKIDKGSLPDISKNFSRNVYNFWKDTLCNFSSNGFDYYERYETRARFSAGMFWAGILGILGGGYLIYYKIGLEIILFSLLIIVVFRLHLGRVRKQEVKVLLFLYISYLQEKNKGSAT
jgi:hypothetical protein